MKPFSVKVSAQVRDSDFNERFHWKCYCHIISVYECSADCGLENREIERPDQFSSP